MAVAHIATTSDWQQRDLDAAISELASDLLDGMDLTPQREHEVRELAVARLRHVANATRHAAEAALALDREDRSADDHVRGLCSRCSRLHCVMSAGVCHGLRRIRQAIDRAHQAYRKTCRRLERA